MTKARALQLLILLMVLAISLVGCEYLGITRETDIPQWEYRVETPRDYSFSREMNAWGGEGWELVTARRARSSSTDEYNYEVILKRPVR